MTGKSFDPKSNNIFVDEAQTSAKPTELTVNEFSDLVQQSNLVEEDNLNALLQTFRQRTAQSDVDSYVVAELLVQAKLLTPWQAKMLLGGRYKGFFLGRYRLLSLIGRGSMGVVYLAEHVRMRRRAALKILPSRFVEDSERLDLFYRESEATAALDHPNVVRAYDVDNEGETYYLVMEYVDGVNLNQLVASQGPLDYTRAAEYIRQAADGLAHAHERGIIHGDVKPANFMLDSSNRVKILDMGLSLCQEVEASPMEFAGKLCGTPAFLAPELGHGGTQVDACSDIYSLGCTFYFLLTGSPPFSSDSLTALLKKHRKEAPRPLNEFDLDVPRELEEICLRMMAKRTEDRFSSAKEVWEALGDWQSKSETPTQSLVRQKEEATSGEPHKILVAEDDEVTQQMLKMQLTKAGYEVRVASDGREAIDAMDSQISVCLFDLNMPHATGMDCLRHVHSHFPKTPVIILTASGEVRDAILAMREGAFDYLTKPCRINNVLMRVEEAIRVRNLSVEDGVSLSSLINTFENESTDSMETLLFTLKNNNDETTLGP